MANWWDKYDGAVAAPTPPPAAPSAAGAPWWAAMEQAAAQQDNEIAGGMAAGDWGWASQQRPAADALPPGDYQMGAADDVPRLDATGRPAPVPTNRDVQALQRDNAAMAYANRGAEGSALVGNSRLSQALAAAPAQAFDARFGSGTAAHYVQADAQPAEQAAGPAFLSGDWWKQQLGGGGDGADYGSGAGYLIDNPLTRGLGQGAASISTGLNELIGRGISAVSPSAGQWWQSQFVAPGVEQQKQLQPAADAGVGSLVTQALGNLGSQLAVGTAAGGAGGAPAATGQGLMGAARVALSNPQLRTAAALGASQAGNEAAQLAAEGKPVSDEQVAAMAATATAANLVPLAGRWSLPARVASGAAVGEATNEANNVVSGRPLGSGAVMAAGLGAALGVLPGHHTPTLADERAALANQLAQRQRVDFLRDGVARQDLEERIGQVAQQAGGEVPEAVARQLAETVAQEHGTSVDALLRAPRGPAEAGVAAADQILAEAHEIVTAARPFVAADTTAIAPEALRHAEPRTPALPEVPAGASRDDLVRAWREASTDAERATAAADIAAYDAMVRGEPVDPAAALADSEATPPPPPVAPEPAPPPAPEPRAASLSLPEAGSVIDRRLAALDELASRARPAEELRSLGMEAGDLEDLLRGEYAKRQAGVARSPANSLTDAELAQAEQRLAAARAALEDHRQAVAAGNQARQLREQLAKVDNDEQLRQLAVKLAGHEATEAAPAAPRVAEQGSAPGAWWQAYETGQPERVDLPSAREDTATYGNASPLQRSGVSEPSGEAGRPAGGDLPGGLEVLANTDAGPVAEAIRTQAPRLFQRTNVVATGEFRSGVDRVQNWRDAAHVIAPLRKSPQEQMLALVTDANNRPLAVLRHTMGLVDQSSVSPAALFGAVAQVPGARHVWFAHNHPSGALQQSSADLHVTQQLHDLMRGSGIVPHGMIVVGPGQRTATYHHPDTGYTGDAGTSSEQPITTAARTGSVPLLERRLRRIPSETDRAQFRSPGDVINWANRNGESGVLLMDNRHRELGFLPMSEAEMSRLRTGDPSSGAAHVMRTVADANAVSSIVMTADHAAGDNVATLLQKSGLRTLDIMVRRPDGSYESAATKGKRIGEQPTFYSREAPEPDGRRALDVVRVEASTQPPEELFRTANEWYREHLQGSQVNAPDGAPVVFSKLGRTEALSTGRRDPRRMAIVARLAELAEKAPIIEEDVADRTNRTGVSYAYAAVPVEINGEIYGIKLIYQIGQDGGRRFYNFRGFDMTDPGALDRGREAEASLGARGSPGSEVTIARLREAFKERPAFSRDQEAGQGAATTEQVRDAARRAWGGRFIGRLERSGVLHFIDTQEALARGLAKSADELAGVKGLYHDGRAYVLTDQVRNLEDVPGIVLHEAGLHYGYDRLTTAEDRQALRARVNRALAAGDADMVKAWQHAEKVGTPARAMHEEAMAYLAEHAPGHGIVTRLMDAVKRGLNRLGIPLDLLESDSAAIRRAARDMLRHAASGERPARAEVDIDGVQPWRASSVGGAPVFSRAPAHQVRQQAAAARTSILSHLAAQGYGQGAIGWTGNPSEYEGWRAGVQKAIAGLFDKMDPVRRAEGAIRDATGQDIADDADVYRLENLMHGRAADRLDALDRASVKPLLKAMKGAGVSPKLLMDYLYARHAPERNARIASINKDMPDGGSGLTTQEANDILAGNAPGPYSGRTISAADLPKLQALAARVDRIRDQTIATLEGSGQITPQLAAQLRSQWKYYVPLRGKEGEPETGHGAGRGVDIKGKPVRRALGRGVGNVAPPNILAEIIGDAQRAIIQAEKARVGRAVLKLATEFPNKEVWEAEPVDLEWRFSESTGEAYLAPKRPTNDQDVLTVMHDGKPYSVRLKDPRIRDAVLNLGAEKAQWLVNTLGRFNRWLSAVSTRYNPAFTPINALRDMTLGMTGLAAEHGARVAADAAAHYLPALRASWRDAAHAPGDASVPDAQKSMDDWAREFAERGGKTGIVHFNDVESTARALEDKFKSGVELLGELRPLAAAGKTLEHLQPIAHVVELANEATENALRLASYVALRKRGMSPDRAASYAKNLTVNFNRKGQWAGVLNTLYLFYNASAQGVRRSLELMRNPKVLGFLGSLAALQASQAALLMSRQGDDGVSDWDAIPDWKKERSLIIALPGQGHYFALPMPYEFGFMTFAGGRLTQAMLDREPSSKGSLVNDLGAGMLQSFSPIPLDNGPTGLAPEVFKIPLHLAENRDDFGRRITADQPYAPYDMPRTAMGKAGTAAPYVWLARALNRAGGGDPDFKPPEIARGLLDWSPEDLQYLSNTMLGGLGSFSSGTWTSVEKLLAGNYKAKKDGQVEVDWPALLRDFPILKSFGWSTDSNRARADRFYDIKDQIERTKAMVQAKLDEGDLQGAQRVARAAGVFADGMTIKTNQDGSPAMRLKHTPRGDVRTYQVGVVPGSLYAAYREVSSGLSQRNEDTGLSEKVQPGVADYNRQIQRAYQLPAAQRTQAIKDLQDRRGGLMGAFLRVYEQRKKAVPTPGT